MKKLLKVSLFLLLLSNIALDLHGYAISHNKDSKLKEVTIFVFTDEKDFLKMLKKQGASTKVLNNMARIIPLVSTGASALATSLANPELVPIIKAVGLGLAGASKYAVGPAKWIMQQKYNLALHKHTKRGNKGKDASWNWKDIQKDEGVDPKDPFGLFVVFLNPKDKKVLWMGPMRSNAAFGFRAVTKDGKLIGERVSFERNKEETLKDPSYVARVYAYIVNRYENPDKIFRDIKRVFSDLKSTYKSFVKKYPDSASRLQFLNTKLDETKTAIKGGMKPEDIQELTAFFKREIEKAKEIAVDPETKEFAKRVMRKFNQFKSAADAIVLKPMAGYQSDAKSTGSTSSIIPELPLLIEGPKGENNYAILGVGKNASADEIKTAYRSLARQWHPDRNQDNKEEATAMFKKIKAAYDELSG